MSDPYETLGLPHGAADAEVRNAYLRLVREFPPDRAPERFAQVRAAYDELRDPARRMEATMFSLSGDDSIAKLTADLRARLIRPDLPAAALLLLAEGP